MPLIALEEHTHPRAPACCDASTARAAHAQRAHLAAALALQHPLQAGPQVGQQLGGQLGLQLRQRAAPPRHRQRQQQRQQQRGAALVPQAGQRRAVQRVGP